ncbi:hypothetical protein D210916BOD24_13820 [Alteromonas sp. D210916BOD_24]|uniref:hypothetical protein n=1 Tax=Alteromonas sp. D210916BOD_24 TaxID=3157618 RepID=UPI00399CDE07
MDIDLEDLKNLILLLEDQPTISSEVERDMGRSFREKIFEKMLNSGETYGEATGAPGMVSSTKNEDEFKDQLNEIDNNLLEQVRIVSEGVHHYFKTGEIPPPYYAWRIAVILRKIKEYELEARFCMGFSKHFDRGVGGRYSKIAERIEKALKLSEKYKHA